jgi:hypothetical protein
VPSHRPLVRVVSECQRFYGAAGIGAALAAGMRLSRSFALPALPAARKSTPLGAGPASDKYHMPDDTRGRCQGLLSPALTGQRYSSGFLPFVRERLTVSSISPIPKVRHCLAF